MGIKAFLFGKRAPSITNNQDTLADEELPLWTKMIRRNPSKHFLSTQNDRCTVCGKLKNPVRNDNTLDYASRDICNDCFMTYLGWLRDQAETFLDGIDMHNEKLAYFEANARTQYWKARQALAIDVYDGVVSDEAARHELSKEKELICQQWNKYVRDYMEHQTQEQQNSQIRDSIGAIASRLS